MVPFTFRVELKKHKIIKMHLRVVFHDRITLRFDFLVPFNATSTNIISLVNRLDLFAVEMIPFATGIAENPVKFLFFLFFESDTNTIS